jgi:hypothetical protein
MTQRSIVSLLAYGLAITSFIILGWYIPFCELSLGNDPRAWFPVVNSHFNSYHMWRIDHIARALSKVLSGWSAHTFIPLSLAILCFGTYRIVRTISRPYATSPVTDWVVSIGATLVTLAITGPDAVTLSALAWIPLLCMSVTVLATVSQARLALGAAPLWLLALFVSVETSIAANQLAPLAAITACLIGFSLLSADAHKPLPQREFFAILVLVCGPALYASLSTPPAPFPDYPYLAHVVPDDGLAGVIRPLIGLDYPLQLVDRGAVQRLYLGPSIALMVLATCCLFMGRRNDRGATHTLLVAACILGAVACLDTALPERFAVIAPLMSVSRLLPWGTSLSLTPWALGLGVWLLCIGATTYLQSAPRLLLAVVVALGACTVTQPTWWNPPLSEKTISTLLEDEALKKVALSPSLAVMRAFEHSTPGFLSNINEFQLLSQREMRTVTGAEALIETSPVGNDRTIDRTADGSLHTRWTSSSNQVGDELFTLRFSRPTPIRGLELDPGEYAADFPRGLSVRGGPCREEDARLIAYFPSWQGALSFTTEGFPYFSGQEAVRVLFAKKELVECIFARQTSTAPFAWSVAEVRLLTD